MSEPEIKFCAVIVTFRGERVYVQATLCVFIKQTKGSVAAELGVVQIPPFQLWLGS